VRLNKLVIFHMCGEEKVKVVLFSVFWLRVALLFCVVFAVSVFVVRWLGSCWLWLPFPELVGVVERES